MTDKMTTCKSAALLKMEACAKQIYAWMACNKLKLDCDKGPIVYYVPGGGGVWRGVQF